MCSTHFKYMDVVKRLKKDRNSVEQYTRKFASIICCHSFMCYLPNQHVWLFHGKVMKLLGGQVGTFYDLTPGNNKKAEWLQEDLRYIYPHNYAAKTVSKKDFYDLAIFEAALHSCFFNSPQGYGYQIFACIEDYRPTGYHTDALSQLKTTKPHRYYNLMYGLYSRVTYIHNWRRVKYHWLM
ncbi:hypothetical protein LXA43DRAFT_1066820 [Ganoderma leucocontextum]|nr:hypothetical protein LXA43DRAFT_1066820 [Ganoderma leucocontextum]